MEKKGEKRVVYLVAFLLLITILFLSLTSAGWFDWLKKITGEAAQTIGLNITVGVPQVITVYNVSTVDMNAAAISSVIINFTVYSPSGAGNLNITSAQLNLTRANENTRQNLSCAKITSSGNYANFTCNVTMWWWDGNGTWNIGARIQDNQSNVAVNTTRTQAIGPTTGFSRSPTALTWAGIGAGATNQTSDNDPLLINNTGNVPLNNITINSTNLRGETTSSLGLWAKNFSVSYFTGGVECTGAACTECGGTGATTMSNKTYLQVITANVTKGNYSINDGDTGQEELYFCIRIAGSELTTQAYSTANETEGDWLMNAV